MEEYKTITAEEFATLDNSQYTIIDLREPDEFTVSAVEGAVNIPFSQFTEKLDTVPKEKPVIVYCRRGNSSKEIAGILAERGYDVTHVEGGYSACREFAHGGEAEKKASSSGQPREFIDARGLKCPGPIVKVADYLRDKPDGTAIHVEATEDAFYSDIQIWCERTGSRLDSITFENGVIQADITKCTSPGETVQVSEKNDKTFVVFSGDLDKTIAAFIMANGAAAMGRRVTMFFTFWGLNILRRPEKVGVAKSFVEKMFGAMMPRGTKKLGLSRMNMGGAGAKMIRWIMKEKGISSLEELIDSAKAHGVRIVACQMSMDIMGIHKEELLDGVELGGVSTFLGSGEQSDMSLFI